VLFEIGLEELPARFIDDAEQQLYDQTVEWLRKNRMDYRELATFSTPRRLTVLIKSIAEQQTSMTEAVRGPAEKIAKDDEGNWTRAALGFTKGQGATVDDIYIQDVKGTPYIFVEKHTEGLPTEKILPSFKDIITSIQFPQNMRWAEETLSYARPIRWLVALYNNEVVPFEIAHVKTSNRTNGHRFLGETVTINDPLQYEQQLKDNYVIVNKLKREKLIVEGINELAESNNFKISIDDDLLREVCHLVEYPTVFLGEYEQSFLSLPAEVLITSMKEHQRYFPVTNSNEELLPYFVGVRNGDAYNLDTVIRGNEKVLHARLADAVFFYEEDQKHTVADHLATLDRVVFHEKLGTIGDKTKRIKHMTKHLTNLLSIDANMTKNALRAASICKFDLPTLMVNEFPELQGVMGEKYALIAGEEEEVARAIREHYLPAHTTDHLPMSQIGAIISLADKLDTIVGCISIGLTPSGSRDPYGLRRQAVAVLRILLEEKWKMTLESLVDKALEQYTELDLIDQVTIDMKQSILNFFKLRATYLLSNQHIEQDVIEATLHNDIGSFPFTVEKARLLSKRRSDPNYKVIQEELMRVLNMASSTKLTTETVDSSLFKTDSERQLYEQLENVRRDVNEAQKRLDAKSTLEHIESLATPIHTFFENNMVMDKNKSLKNNRLTLIHQVADVILKFADLTKIQWRQHF